jgi:polyisoprenoid-binding protein YceI
MSQILARPRHGPAAGMYRLDRTRCLAEFAVRHFTVSTVRGSLRPVDGTLVIDPDDPLRSKVSVELDAASLDTGSAARDAVLTGPQFLDAGNHPVVRFESTELVGTTPHRFDVLGDLHLAGEVGQVRLRGRVASVEHGAVSFAATGSLHRADFGLTWARFVEGFGLVVRDAVRLTIGAEFVA